MIKSVLLGIIFNFALMSIIFLNQINYDIAASPERILCPTPWGGSFIKVVSGALHFIQGLRQGPDTPFCVANIQYPDGSLLLSWHVLSKIPIISGNCDMTAGVFDTPI